MFIGAKMLAEPALAARGLGVPTWLSLAVIASCITTAALVSWAATVRERAHDGPPADGPADPPSPQPA